MTPRKLAALGTDACRPDPRRGTAPLECRGPPRRPRPRRDCRRRPVRAAFRARLPRHQRPVRIQGARRPEPDRHRPDREPGHQPVRRKLRQERPIRAQYRHRWRQRPGHRLRHEFNAADGQGQPALPSHQVHRQPRAGASRSGQARRRGQHERQGQEVVPRPLGLDRRPLRPVLLRPDRLHRHDHEADDRHGGRRRQAAATATPTDFFEASTRMRSSCRSQSQLPNSIGVWATTSYTDAYELEAATRWAGRRSTRSSTRPPTRTTSTSRCPSQQPTARRQVPRQRREHADQFFSSLDSEGSYSNGQAAARLPGSYPRRPALRPRQRPPGAAERSSPGR